jgi:hypothetical protein
VTIGDPAALLERLRDPSENGAAARLAGLLVEDALARTAFELVDVRFTAAALRDAVRALTSSDAATARIVAAITAAEAAVAAEARPFGALLPAPLGLAARELASLPSTPPRDVVIKLLDREPLKKLLRAQVTDTLIAFGRRAASPVSDNPIARGLGGLGKRALGAGGKSGALGALASAVSGEVERQVEKRANDFADTAVAGILEGLADQISDPTRAREQSAMRLALLDGLLELTGAEAAQLVRAPAVDRVAAVRKALAAWSAQDSFEGDIETVVTAALAGDGGRTLGEIVADLGLRDVVATRARELVQRRLSPFVQGEAFAKWLEALLSA